MNRKLLIAAMALPMLFTACSQDELFEGVNNTLDTPQARGFYATLAPTFGEGEGSRALWDGSKLTWEDTDKISVYWLGDQVSSSGNLNGKFNSIFKTEDGNAFTSESMVFEGGNIAVFPGNLSFIKQGDIELKVPLVQGENTILETPYISNCLNIVDPENPAYPGLDNQIAGYNNGLYSPMKMAANVLYLNLELANTANLAQYDFNVESVALVSKSTDKKAFGSIAKLKTEGVPNDKGVVTYDDGADAGTEPDELQTITKAVRVATIGSSNTLTSKAITKTGEGKYLVKFVVLPTSTKAFDKDAEIVIYTNCGRINLTTAQFKADGTKKNNVATDSELKLDANSTDFFKGVVTGAKDDEGKAIDQTIAQTLNALTTRQTASESSNFAGEFIGKKFTRTVKASMADATLNDSPVKSSTDIITYVSIYKAMGSDENMNLILTAQEEEGDTFVDLTKAAIDAMDGLNDYKNGVVKATLSMGEGMTGVQLAEAGALYFNNDLMWKEVDDNSLYMVLAAGKEWTMDDNYNFNKVGKIINNGKLIINGTTDKSSNQRTLNELVENRGTLKIGGNNTLQVGENLINVYETVDNVTTDGVVEVAQYQNLVFNEDVESGINGTINVAQGAFLTVAADKNVTSNATINNYGLVSAEAGNGGIWNEGTINVLRDGAITYVQDNANGVINLLKRNNEAVVYGAKGKIVYNYDSTTDGTTFARKADDKFTYVVFGEENAEITLATTAMKVNGVNALPINDLSMQFTDETNLKTNGLSFESLEVATGAHLQVLSGNTVFVKNLANSGVITVGGTIYYHKTKSGNGKVYSVGNGAIVYAPTMITAGEDNTAEENLIAAIAAGENVVLGEDVVLTKRLNIPADYEGTIDLGGKTIEYNANDGSYAMLVRGKLTLKNGEVKTTVYNNPCMYVYEGAEAVVNCTMNSESNCIQSVGKLTIEGGTYTSTNATGSAVRINASTAIPWELNINGGTFTGKWAGLYIANNYKDLANAGKAVIKNATFKGDSTVHGGGTTPSGCNWNGGDIVFDLVKNISISDCTLSTSSIHSESQGLSVINGEEIKDSNDVYNTLFAE